jgi:type I restriction enzyme S subunit
MLNLITEHMDIRSGAGVERKNGGRGRKNNSNGQTAYGIKKLRELILELAVRGKLVPQNPNDESAGVLLEKIAKEKQRLIKEKKIKNQKKLPEIGEDEKPFELPEGWEWTKLGLISQINPRNEAEDNLTVSFVPMPLIFTSHTGQHEQERKKWCDIKKGYTHFANGDVGVAKITPCFENSKAVVFSGLENGIGAGTTELHIARPFGSTLVPRYILLFLKSPVFLQTGETKMTGTAGQKRLPKDFFSEYPLPFPPLAEQHRIVAKVDELMALCDKLEQRQNEGDATHRTLVSTLLATLTSARDAKELAVAWQRLSDHFHNLFTTPESIDQLKQTILQLAVMGKLVPQDPNDEPAGVLLEKIAREKQRLIKEGKIKKQKKLPEIGEDEKPFELPEGWLWVRVWDVAKFITSGSRGWAKYYSDEGAKFLTMGNLSRGGYQLRLKNLRFVNPPKDGEGSRTKLCGNDLLISITGEVGNLGLVPKDFGEAYINQHTCLLRFIPCCQNRYFPEFMRSPLALFQFNAPQRGIKNSFRLGDVGEMIIPLPPLVEQHRIVAKVDQLMTLCDTLKSRLADAQTTQRHLADAVVDQAVA